MQFRNGKMYIPTDKGSLSVNGVGYLEIESDLIQIRTLELQVIVKALRRLKIKIYKHLKA